MSSNESEIRVRNFNHDNITKLNQTLANLDWNEVLSIEDPSLAAIKFNNILQSTLDSTCPFSKSKSKNKRINQPLSFVNS